MNENTTTPEVPQEAVVLNENTLGQIPPKKGSKNWVLVGTLVTICLISIGLIAYLLFNDAYPLADDTGIDAAITEIDGLQDDLDLDGMEELDNLTEPEEELDYTLETLDDTLDDIENETDLSDFDDPGQ